MLSLIDACNLGLPPPTCLLAPLPLVNHLIIKMVLKPVVRVNAMTFHYRKTAFYSRNLFQ